MLDIPVSGRIGLGVAADDKLLSMKVAWRGLLVAMLVSTAPVAQAHDLGGTRARLVQHDDRHLSLTLLLRLSDVFQHDSVDPTQYREKMLSMAAMTPAAFATALAKLEANIAAETRIRINGASEVPITRWRWPDPAVAHALVQSMVMNAVSGGSATDVHEEPFEADAEVVSNAPITSAAMQFPNDLGPVVLVGYRPMQVIVDKPGFAQSVRF